MKANLEIEEVKQFTQMVKDIAKKHNYNSKDWQKIQHDQIQNLMDLENQFRLNIINTPLGDRVYLEFVQWITYHKKNILCARPYFRERQRVFSLNISDAIRNEVIPQLYKYHVNFQFISFVYKHSKLYPGSTLYKLYHEVKKARQELVEANTPLAVNRARVFYSRTPNSHLTYLDMIELAIQGLLHGVDKYSPGDGEINPKQFRSTVIGVMGGLFLENYNQTLLHFFPQDKRKLYRAHKALGKFGTLIDNEEIAKIVNEGVEEGNEFIKNVTDEYEIAELLAAASTVSADSSFVNNNTQNDIEESVNIISKTPAPDSCRPDVQLEEKNSMLNLMEAIDQLTIFEQKLVRLMGVRADSVYIKQGVCA